MSKRGADVQLTDRNYRDSGEDDSNAMAPFQLASKEKLAGRIIKPLKGRKVFAQPAKLPSLSQSSKVDAIQNFANQTHLLNKSYLHKLNSLADISHLGLDLSALCEDYIKFRREINSRNAHDRTNADIVYNSTIIKSDYPKSTLTSLEKKRGEVADAIISGSVISAFTPPPFKFTNSQSLNSAITPKTGSNLFNQSNENSLAYSFGQPIKSDEVVDGIKMSKSLGNLSEQEIKISNFHPILALKQSTTAMAPKSAIPFEQSTKSIKNIIPISSAFSKTTESDTASSFSFTKSSTNIVRVDGKMTSASTLKQTVEPEVTFNEPLKLTNEKRDPDSSFVETSNVANTPPVSSVFGFGQSSAPGTDEKYKATSEFQNTSNVAIMQPTSSVFGFGQTSAFGTNAFSFTSTSSASTPQVDQGALKPSSFGQKSAFTFTPSTTTQPINQNTKIDLDALKPSSFGQKSSFTFTPQTVAQPITQNSVLESQATTQEDEFPVLEQIGDSLMKGAGEENDETLFQVKSKLYIQTKTNGKLDWDMNGVGILRINCSPQSTRILCRADTSGRVLLNSRIYKGMRVVKNGEKQFIVAVEIDSVMKNILIRVGQAGDCDRLIAVIKKAQESMDVK